MNFSRSLIKWYDCNKRELPWRNTRDAYKIWISEIILQQTKVSYGLKYYLKFLKKFPTIHDLSEAKENEVLKVWEGLGYYSRARNLHHTSKFIVNNLNGIFPNTYLEILNLKGIGPYTAAAISSFAFKLPFAVLDGNVIRLLSRYFGIKVPFDNVRGKNLFQQLSQKLLNYNNPDLHNQAIMDFGALICSPKLPKCEICHFNNLCYAFNNNLVNKLPFKQKKIKIKKRHFNYLIIEKNNFCFIKKRNEGIWTGLYEFPKIESEDNLHNLSSKDFSKYLNNKYTIIRFSNIIVHKLSHQHIYAKFWHIKSNVNQLEGCMKVRFNKLSNYPFSTLILNYLKDKF
tara:strand:+ start:573 stop:1598 length:1026 start_codon:yes stop_codon:yes gene_type:complete